MSKFVLEVDLDGAAFHDDDGDFHPTPELVNMLREVSKKLVAGYVRGPVRDVNGNHVGDFLIEE